MSGIVLAVGDSVELARDFAPQDGLRFDRGLAGVVVAIDEAHPDGPYRVAFFREGHFEGDHANLGADQLVLVRPRADPN